MKRRRFLQAAAAAALVGPADPTPTMNYLSYPLTPDAWVHHWLVAGPQVLVIPDAEYKFNPALRPPVMEKFRRKDSMVSGTPAEGQTLVVEGADLPWRFVACQDDHLVDLTNAFYRNSRYLRSWAYTQLVCAVPALKTRFHLFGNGPMDVWLNGRHVHRSDDFDYLYQHERVFDAPLAAGNNTLLVRFEQAVTRNALYTLALRLENAPAQTTVRVPTAATPAGEIRPRQAREAALARVHLNRDVYTPDQEIRLNISPLPAGAGAITVELRRRGQTDDAPAARQVRWEAGSSAAGANFVPLGNANDLPPGHYQVVLTAQGGQQRRELSLSVAPNTFAQTPVGESDEARRQTVLENLARKRPSGNGWGDADLHAPAALLELNRAGEVSPQLFEKIIEGINQRRDGSDFALAVLLDTFLRYPDFFAAALQPAIEACVLGFKYWTNEPGSTAMVFNSENHQLAFHTAEILAGQLFPAQTFTNNQQSGAWHRDHGESRARAWLQKKLARGMEEWDANGYFEADIKLLVVLLEHAQALDIQNMAEAVLNKLLLAIALNSHRGVFGSTHGRTGVDYIKYARHEPTASSAYLLWGLGTGDDPAGGAGALARARRYKLPGVIRQIAHDVPEALWSRERQGFEPVVDKVTYKTPDYMLCSAQDWKKGERGYQQHLWQATLAPDAVVFTTHPACISQDGNQRPNFWAGNASLPRVAQWKNTLVAAYRVSEKEWLDWTHAYFPTWAFDEWKVEGAWAFARKSDGYVALSAANGLTLIESGDSALRELRSPGRENVWLCQMGRKTVDGDFAAFQQKVQSAPPVLDTRSVRCQTLGGDALAFGWDGPLLINNKEQPITNFPHFDNPYVHAPWPADKIEIRHDGQELVLDWTKEAK